MHSVECGWMMVMNEAIFVDWFGHFHSVPTVCLNDKAYKVIEVVFMNLYSATYVFGVVGSHSPISVVQHYITLDSQLAHNSPLLDLCI
jgi:hypothetical protein